MGSEGPKRVIIHVTGFKKLNGIANNPTETIVSNLKGYIEKKGVCPGISIGSCTVLETAGEYAPPMLYKVLKSAISSDTISGSKEVVWLHMGMIDGSSKFTIERRAVNEATFLCPDELGWQPKTSCSIDAILEFLEKMKCYDAMISDDAGTFMCNYLYYHSFCFAEQKGLATRALLMKGIDGISIPEFGHSGVLEELLKVALATVTDLPKKGSFEGC
ncbi:uncharacterized protein LOC112524708 isoform X2 [Cynara cardunculus var. scolymus]|uniref:uncharacterized protein LOC112524708 isoform X2 n=1 Tax=Cynara cardunculus var. scolymus TaxID=59895 RepID=UPI000D625025|nr:uncharacterized protein LOC112524708 isoform X2 [Cynara cardunculus var. scolymus]